MAEYIDKDIAVKGLRMAHDLDGADFVANIPAADVRENVKARWENVEITQTDVHLGNLPTAITSMFCPVCKRYHNEVYFYGNPIENANFCPRCGADMTGGNDG